MCQTEMFRRRENRRLPFNRRLVLLSPAKRSQVVPEFGQMRQIKPCLLGDVAKGEASVE